MVQLLLVFLLFRVSRQVRVRDPSRPLPTETEAVKASGVLVDASVNLHCPDETFGLKCEHRIEDFPYRTGGWSNIDGMLGHNKQDGYQVRQQLAAEWLSNMPVTTVLELGPYALPISNFLDTSQSNVRDVIEVDPTTKISDVEMGSTRPHVHLVRALFDDVFMKGDSVVKFNNVNKNGESALLFLGMAGCYGDSDTDGNTVRGVLKKVVPHFSTLILEYSYDTEQDNSKKCFDYVMNEFGNDYEIQEEKDLNMQVDVHPHRHMALMKKKGGAPAVEKTGGAPAVEKSPSKKDRSGVAPRATHMIAASALTSLVLCF